jgi:hypothetical protein
MNSNSLSAKESREKYNRILESCEPQCKGKYCFYRKFMESSHPNLFTIIQVKLIEKMKWNVWGKENPNITWEEASFKWTDIENIQRGHAAAYRMVFDNLTEEEIEKINDDEFIEIVLNRTIKTYEKLQKIPLDNQQN